MEHGRPSNVGEHVGSKGASTWLTIMPVQECYEVSEHAESKHAQDVRGSIEGLTRGSEVLLSIDLMVLLAILTTLQGSVANLAALLEKQYATHNPSVALAIVTTQLVPQTPPPPLLPGEGTVKEMKLSNFLKLNPPVFTGEDGNEDPQWFLDGSENDVWPWVVLVRGRWSWSLTSFKGRLTNCGPHRDMVVLVMPR